MPLMADQRVIPAHRTGSGSSVSIDVLKNLEVPRSRIRVGLLNNMPDSALRDTEIQFFKLLEEAAGDLLVQVTLYALPDIPRGQTGKEHMARFYHGTDELLNSEVDALIITGTEPRQPNLRREPYWRRLKEILDWAETRTASTVLSCLAAHASILHFDGIERHPLLNKKFGVFRESIIGGHPLTAGVSGPVGIPHSRWNEVRESELVDAGYIILTKSVEAGVDLFVKKKRRSLFVHFQGHPEYGARTLLKEYRRDIGRYLKNEREKYPVMPQGYFENEGAKLVADFEERARSKPDAALLAEFPTDELVQGLRRQWRSAAPRIYANWLNYVAASKVESPKLAPSAALVHSTRAH